MTSTLHTVADLRAAIRDLRPDAAQTDLDITADWCRDQMHDLGITRYEDLDAEMLDRIADRVDALAE